jgi:hypothetical protein
VNPIGGTVGRGTRAPWTQCLCASLLPGTEGPCRPCQRRRRIAQVGRENGLRRLKADRNLRIAAKLKHRAKVRGIDWTLAPEQVSELIRMPCTYCGLAAGNSTLNRKLRIEYNGLDRVDSTRGYSMDNVVPCCKRCNFAKSDQTVDDFLGWALRIAAHASRAEAA